MQFLRRITCKKLWTILENFRSRIEKRTEEFGAQYIAFGIFGILNYPLFYLIWIFYSNKSYESFTLRLSATFLCLLLLLKNYWPKKLKPWLPVYWYFTLLFCLPFFFFFMLFKNGSTNVWLMSSNTILFWLLLMVDWTAYIIIFTCGIIFAFLGYILTTPAYTFDVHQWWGIALQFIASFIVVIFFAHQKRQFDTKKLQAMQALGASIAHELRTPLAALNAAAENLKKYFPYLFDAYRKAEAANLSVQKIKPIIFNKLETQPMLMESETKAANTFIDMLLMSVHPSLDETVVTFSISKCINEALERYPFIGEQRNLVCCEKDQDFLVNGKNELIVHVLFNLLKNAIYYVGKAGKGNIHIWLKRGVTHNELYFKDTGMGISKKVLPHIFDRFFTNTPHGAGIGLTFCKIAMQSLGGDITCESIERNYTQFILRFPNTFKQVKDLT